MAEAHASGPARTAASWRNAFSLALQLTGQVSSYLPLFLMALLALATWWLVKNAALLQDSRIAAPLRHVPDYTMTRFTVQRFDRGGALTAQIEGDVALHYPDTDTIEVDNPRIRSIARDGRVTVATARHAISNGDGSEMQLQGGARVVREALKEGEPPIEFRGEFLHAFLTTERVRSHLPVVVTQGTTEIRADTLDYDNVERIVHVKGKVRATFVSRGAARPQAAGP
jgi:lipopolysaccharide export system protein LptC